MTGHFLESFDASYEKLHHEFDRFGEVSWDTLAWHVRRGAMTGAAYVELRIQELAIHDWDIRSATETIPCLYPDSVPILLDMTPRWLGMCFRSSAKLPKPVVYGFNVDSQNYRLTVTGDGFDMISGEATEADFSLSATGEQFLLFTYGRLTAADGIHLGRLSINGAVAHLDQFEVWFKGLEPGVCACDRFGD